MSSSLALAFAGLHLIASQGVSPAAVEDLRNAIVGKSPDRFHERFKVNRVRPRADGGQIYEWFDMKGGPGMNRGTYSSRGSYSICSVYALVKDGVITKVEAYGDAKRCSHMFWVMKSLP